MFTLPANLRFEQRELPPKFYIFEQLRSINQCFVNITFFREYTIIYLKFHVTTRYIMCKAANESFEIALLIFTIEFCQILSFAFPLPSLDSSTGSATLNYQNFNWQVFINIYIRVPNFLCM